MSTHSNKGETSEEGLVIKWKKKFEVLEVEEIDRRHKNVAS